MEPVGGTALGPAPGLLLCDRAPPGLGRGAVGGRGGLEVIEGYTTGRAGGVLLQPRPQTRPEQNILLIIHISFLKKDSSQNSFK